MTILTVVVVVIIVIAAFNKCCPDARQSKVDIDIEDFRLDKTEVCLRENFRVRARVVNEGNKGCRQVRVTLQYPGIPATILYEGPLRAGQVKNLNRQLQMYPSGPTSITREALLIVARCDESDGIRAARSLRVKPCSQAF